MKNVTLSLDDDDLAWVRVEAAKQAKSISRYLADMITERRAPRLSQAQVLDRFLGGPLWPGISEDLPTRAELYDDHLLRRHEHPDLCPGSDEPGETGGCRDMAESPRRKERHRR